MNVFKSVGAKWKSELLIAVALIAGCSKISQSNFEKVQNGMTQQQVEAILGPGKEQGSSSVAVPGMSVGSTYVPGISTSMKVLSWQDGSKIITISFQNDQVITKAQAGL